MPHLKHTPATDGAFSYGGETYRMENGLFAVDDESVAADIVADYSRVDYADAQPDESDSDDAEADASDTDGYQCGVNGCSREVDSPQATCWQHSTDESEG